MKRPQYQSRNNNKLVTSSMASSIVDSPSTKESSTNSSTQATTTSTALLDFIGSSSAVKNLFALPLDMNHNLTVVLHNLGNGTLMIDNGEFSTLTATNNHHHRQQLHHSMLQLPSESSSDITKASTTTALALSAVSSFLQEGPPPSSSSSTTTTTTTQATIDNTDNNNNINNNTMNLNDDTLEQAASAAIASPRQYLHWKLHDYNMCIASDALIYRTSAMETATRTKTAEQQQQQHPFSTSQALAIRVINTSELKQQQLALQQQQQQQQRSTHSYAQVVAKPQQKQEHTTSGTANPRRWSLSTNTTLSYFSQIQLQSTVLPTTATPSSSSFSLSVLEPPTVETNSSTASSPTNNSKTSLSAVFTCLDAYLDNVMANVPQLALCLAEKGFIQSIKLLRTEDIPKSMIHSTNTSTTTSTTPDTNEALFDPTVIDVNATILLRFLKQHCSSDNSTYLLHREAGQPNIQLYDVTAISQQRQKKWIYWLAMVSYKFALSIQQLLSKNKLINNKRDLRSRQRNLLLTSIELLEELADMDGVKHETIRATLNEHVADTYLKWSGSNTTKDATTTTTTTTTTNNAATMSNNNNNNTLLLPYQDVNEDGLNKASDYLSKALRILEPLLFSARKSKSEKSTAGSTEEESALMEINALSQQLYRIHSKLVYVSLRLADYHFIKYWSSSIIQVIRKASRHLAESISLIPENIQEANLQYKAVWSYCGHFARSFTGDTLWRDRGHTNGEDVINVLQDVENACHKWILLPIDKQQKQQHPAMTTKLIGNNNLTDITHGRVTLVSLSPLVLVASCDTANTLEEVAEGIKNNHHHKTSSSSLLSELPDSLQLAGSYLDSQSVLKREKLRILVAAALCYDRASLKKQLGDTCNEIGKIVLSCAREILSKKLDSSFDHSDNKSITATALCLLYSAEFWFEEGLNNFEQYDDVCNIALLRCNLCQCCKVKANAANLNHVAADHHSSSEKILQKAIEHLKLAHTALGEREKDPKTWDVISDQLAAAFLVLGVRRRQSILGGAGYYSSSSSSAPTIMTETTTSSSTATMRLSPGEERSILQPMESALTIYNKLNNSHQAAATHYQLALFYTKIWMCQRDETKTREKLSAAFHHYSASHRYFFNEMKGNEPTFVILTLDLSNLYSAVSGPACLSKALSCCFDSIYAFSADSVSAAVERRHKQGGNNGENNTNDWFEKMKTLQKTLEDQVFRVLHSLVRLEKNGTKFKEMYRVALTSKVCASSAVRESQCIEETFYPIHQILLDIKNSYDKYFISK